MTWAPDYCTAAEAKSYLRIDSGDTADDAVIGYAITAASRTIDKVTNRQFGLVAAPEARAYIPYRSQARPTGWGYWVVEIDDLMTTTGLTIVTAASVTATSDHYKTWPRNASQKSSPWTSIQFDQTFSGFTWGFGGSFSGTFSTDNELTITAQWGWTTVPVTIKQACLLQVARWFARRDAPFGIAGSPESGSEMRLLAKLDADVAVMVKPYYRWWGAA